VRLPGPLCSIDRCASVNGARVDYVGCRPRKRDGTKRLAKNPENNVQLIKSVVLVSVGRREDRNGRVKLVVDAWSVVRCASFQSRLPVKKSPLKMKNVQFFLRSEESKKKMRSRECDFPFLFFCFFNSLVNL
jgi:hypothetical protein